MANVEKARETIRVIRENSSRLDMTRWAGGEVNPHASHWSECGTTFCFFGWQCVLDGLRPQRLTYSGHATGHFIDADGKTVHPFDHGRASLGLTTREVEAIAYRDQVTNVDNLEWVVEAVISGDWEYCECHGRPDEGCPDCHYRGIVRPSEQSVKP